MEENNVNEQLDENHLIAIRKEKLEELKKAGKDPFKITKYNRTHLSQNIKNHYDDLEGKDVSVAGRIMAKRIMGKASFCTIQDAEGKIQSYVSINDLGGLVQPCQLDSLCVQLFRLDGVYLIK